MDRPPGGLWSAPARSSRGHRLILLAIMVLAALIRIPGVLWGLPKELHPDEPVITEGAIDLIARNSFSPTTFSRPDHLEIELDSILYRIYAFLSGGHAPQMFAQDPAAFIAIARTVTVLFSLAAVGIAFLIGRRFGGWAGPIAAFAFAVFPPFVANSSLATPDMWLTCLLTAVVWCCLRYLERPDWRNLVGSCVLTALAVAVKYPGALGAIPIVAVVVMVLVRTGDRPRAVRHLALAPVAFLVALFLVAHTLLTDFPQVRAQLVGQSGSGHLGASGLGYPARAWFYVQYLGGWMGVLLIAAALFGGYQCVRTRETRSIPLLVGVPFWLAVSALGLHWFRWSLPMAITPLLLAAIGLGAVIDRTRNLRSSGRRHAKAVTAGVAALLVLTSVTPLAGSAATVGTFVAGDTRLVSLPWLQARGIQPQNTIYDGYTPFLPGAPALFVRQFTFRDGVLAARDPAMKYVIMSSYMYERIFADRPPDIVKYYRAVEQLPLVAEWVPTQGPDFNGLAPMAPRGALDLVSRYASGAWTGPTIQVYALPSVAGSAD